MQQIELRIVLFIIYSYFRSMPRYSHNLACSSGCLTCNETACLLCADPLMKGINCENKISQICDSHSYFDPTDENCYLCTKLFANCLSCNINECIFCADNYYLSVGNCFYCQSYCQICESSSKCLICADKLKTGDTCSINVRICLLDQLFNGTECTPCATTIIGCLLCNEISCSLCQTGYYLNGNTCSSNLINRMRNKLQDV
jgi:proprotein convertase subtilisin/kexin type 5